MPRLAIIGLGLMGGSLGLALKRAGLKDLEIVGQDNERGVVGRARKRGAIDRDVHRPTDAVDGAAVVVIATPISQIEMVLESIAPAIGNGAVVTDTASTKRDVVRWAEKLLPREVSFVGGHPIAGKTEAGLEAADADIFQGRPWAITPSVSATEQAVKTVENLVDVVGAKPVIVDAEEHDSYLAGVSHLPLLLSTVLFSLARESQAWPDLATFSGPGFRDMTRLSSTSLDLSHDICLTNRENLVHWLDRFGEELRRFRGLVADSESQEELIKALAKVSSDHDEFLRELPSRPRQEQKADTLSSGERMLTFMVGEYVVRRTKEIEEFMSRHEGGDDEFRRRRGGR